MMIVILTSFVAEIFVAMIPWILNFNIMCKIVERGHCKFGGDTCIGLEDIARKREGARNSPPPQWGAG